MDIIDLKSYFDTPMSRSQAKRLIHEYKFKDEIILDMRNIGFVGRSFIDELFRVNKDEKFKLINTNENIKKVILGVLDNSNHWKYKKGVNDDE